MTHLRGTLSRLAAVAILWGAIGCAEPLPAHAAYAPADCPTADTTASVMRHGRLFDAGAPREEARPQEQKEERSPERMKLEAGERPGEDDRVDLNTATQAELEALPGIGPSLAKRIMARRERRAFTRVSQLKRVKGIGKAKYRELKERVRVK